MIGHPCPSVSENCVKVVVFVVRYQVYAGGLMDPPPDYHGRAVGLICLIYWKKRKKICTLSLILTSPEVTVQLLRAGYVHTHECCSVPQ